MLFNKNENSHLYYLLDNSNVLTVLYLINMQLVWGQQG